MQNLSLVSLFDIQLFAEGGGDGGTGGGDAGAGPAGQNTEAAVAQPQTGGKRNPLADVRYGKQEDAPAAAGQAETEDRNAQFEALIKGEYKDLYEQRLQDTISKRLKGNESTVQKYNALAPVLEMLGSKYGVDAADSEALAKAIEEDETFYEDEALEKGMTVQQVKEIRKMQRENAELRQQMEAQHQQERADQILAKWQSDSEALKQIYPSFNLEQEMQNEQFRALLTSNIDVRTAYEVCHKDEIISSAMQFTAGKVQEKVANAVRAGQKRPAEGAMGNRSSVVVKSDVSKLTKADRDEIDRRVARGERVVF
jgi:hypothetical protein